MTEVPTITLNDGNKMLFHDLVFGRCLNQVKHFIATIWKVRMLDKFV